MYATDGSDYLYHINGETLSVTHKVRVKDPQTNAYIDNLNELEFVKGYVYANIWLTDTLVKIDPENGQIVKKWDISSLKKAE